jgi:hypothetical protein
MNSRLVGLLILAGICLGACMPAPYPIPTATSNVVVITPDPSTFITPTPPTSIYMPAGKEQAEIQGTIVIFSPLSMGATPTPDPLLPTSSWAGNEIAITPLPTAVGATPYYTPTPYVGLVEGNYPELPTFDPNKLRETYGQSFPVTVVSFESNSLIYTPNGHPTRASSLVIEVSGQQLRLIPSIGYDVSYDVNAQWPSSLSSPSAAFAPGTGRMVWHPGSSSFCFQPNQPPLGTYVSPETKNGTWTSGKATLACTSLVIIELDTGEWTAASRLYSGTPAASTEPILPTIYQSSTYTFSGYWTTEERSIYIKPN